MDVLHYFEFYKLWNFGLFIDLIFKFSSFLGNDALIKEADVIFLYLLFKICNILTGCYMQP